MIGLYSKSDPHLIGQNGPLLTFRCGDLYNTNAPGHAHHTGNAHAQRDHPSMPLSVKELHTKDQTAAEMYRLVDRYAGDLHAFNAGGAPLSALSLPEFYAAIRAIPYRQDVTGIEVVTRPYLMLTAPGRGWDCKKKAIAIASWLKLHEIPYRFVAVSRRHSGDIHHVIVQALIDSEWVDIDATYPHNRLFEREAWTAIEPLAGEGRPVERAVLVSMAGDGDPSAGLTYEYVSTLRRVHPEYLGDFGISAGGIVAIIVAAVSAAATVTVAIIEGVQNKRERESRERTEAARIASYETIAVAQAAAASTAAEAEAEQVTQGRDMIKKWIIPATVAAGALLLLR